MSFTSNKARDFWKNDDAKKTREELKNEGIQPAFNLQSTLQSISKLGRESFSNEAI